MAFKPKFTGCTVYPGCFVKKYLPDFEPLKKAGIAKQLYIGDINGVIVLENGNTLYLEYKTASKPVDGVQLKVYKSLSAIKGQEVLVVWHEKGLPDSPVGGYFIRDGETAEQLKFQNGIDDLIGEVSNWAESSKVITALPAPLPSPVPALPKATEAAAVNDNIDLTRAREALENIESHLD